jgi:RNA polymerase sigma-70 factor (ECF subfamily)
LPNELLERIDVANFLNKALEKLSIKYRMVLLLRYNDHFTFREIAEILGESIDTIKSRHRRGIAVLRELLREK